MEPFKKFSLMDESKVITSYNTILNLSPMELTQEERERIEKEAQNWWHTAPIITSECLKKNEEIERLKYWQKEKEIEISAERISVAVAESETSLRKELEINQQEFQVRNSELLNDLYRKLQVSEERIAILQEVIETIQSTLKALGTMDIRVPKYIADQMEINGNKVESLKVKFDLLP